MWRNVSSDSAAGLGGCHPGAVTYFICKPKLAYQLWLVKCVHSLRGEVMLSALAGELGNSPPGDFFSLEEVDSVNGRHCLGAFALKTWRLAAVSCRPGIRPADLHPVKLDGETILQRVTQNGRT